MSRVLVLVADGSEEMECIITVDILRRAQVDVVLAALTSQQVECSRGVRVLADSVLGKVDPASFDALVLPGGARGVDNMLQDHRVPSLVREFVSKGKWVAAICAAPKVLAAAGVLKGAKFTCYPGTEKEIREGTHVDQKVVRDGRIITSQGPGTSFYFALEIVECLCGKAVAEQVANGVLVGRYS